MSQGFRNQIKALNSPQFVEKLQWIEASQVCLNLQVHSNIK